MPVTGGLRQEDCEFEAILPMQGDCLKKKSQTNSMDSSVTVY
jgi:hypothetical protein